MTKVLRQVPEKELLKSRYAMLRKLPKFFYRDIVETNEGKWHFMTNTLIHSIIDNSTLNRLMKSTEGAETCMEDMMEVAMLVGCSLAGFVAFFGSINRSGDDRKPGEESALDHVIRMNQE